MTVHDLHDALNLLPGDLVTAADKIRTAPKAVVISWRRWVSLAAVLVLVLGTSLVFARELMPGMGSDQKSTAAEAPAAAAPMAPQTAEQEVAADEAVPEEPAADAPAAGSVTGSKNSMKEEAHIGHSHRFAGEEETVEEPVKGYCGNMTVTIDVAGQRHVISGSDAVAVTDILINLDYDPAQVCRCMTDITVDTETLTGIQLNAAEGFARCDRGQAALTEEQASKLQQIIDALE